MPRSQKSGERRRASPNVSRPTNIAFLPDGTFFISDGYDGTRVAKFDPEGNRLLDWESSPRRESHKAHHR